MNLMNESERNFVNALVDGTQKVLMTSRLSRSEKLDTFQRAIRAHNHYAKRLRLALAKTDAPAERGKIERLIQLRDAAVNYLVSTAKWMVSQDQFGGSLRERPRIFAEPPWSQPATQDKE